VTSEAQIQDEAPAADISGLCARAAMALD